jgi:hypothetical protein
MHLSIIAMVGPKIMVVKTQWRRMERMVNSWIWHQNNHHITYLE